jgi:hypothetical protein
MSVKISELTASSAVTSNDFVPIVDYETVTTKRASASQILDYVTGSTFNSLTVTNLTASNVSGTNVQFTNAQFVTISGSTGLFAQLTASNVTGTNAQFTNALFTNVVSTTLSASTGLFAIISGSTVTGSLAKFTTLSASAAEFSGSILVYGTASLSSNPSAAYIIYSSSLDKLVVFPGLYVSGNLTGSGLGAFQTVSASNYLGLPSSSGGNPGGTNTTVQFNSGSAFSGSTSLIYDYTTNILSGTNTQFTNAQFTTLSASTGLFAELTASNVTGANTQFTNAQFINVQSTNAAFQTVSASTYLGLPSSSGGNPGGTNTSVQFNSGSTFSGSTSLIYDYTTNTLSGTTAQFVSVTASFNGNVNGTSSHASNASLLNGTGSSNFALLAPNNTFTGINSFTNEITGTTAYFSSNVYINGTASIAFLNTISQSSLLIGDKYITILSGAADHVSLDGSGILWGSGSTGPTVNELGANAHLRYRNSLDKLEIFPGLYVSGSTSISGNLIVTGSITELSTRRIKTNIKSLNNELITISKLNPVSYTRLDDGRKEYGFISEEVKEVYPEFVVGEGISYPKMVSILVSAVKELTNKVEKQQNEIEILKNTRGNL